MLNEAFIYFNDIKRHLPDMVEWWISCTKIIQCNLNTKRLYLTEYPLHAHHVIDCQTLCHLKTQISRFYAHLINYAFDFLNYVILQQLHHRQIYVDLVVRMSHVIPVPAVLRRLS